MHGQSKLSQVIEALRAAGCLAGRLHRRQQQRNQDADDGNDDEQLNEGEAVVDHMAACIGGRTIIHRFVSGKVEHYDDLMNIRS